MDAPAILILVASCAVSFGLGRLFVHLRKRSQAKKVQARPARTPMDDSATTPAKNKSKRRRQQRARNAGEN